MDWWDERVNDSVIAADIEWTDGMKELIILWLQLALNGMFGDPKNKWFDKSMNFVTFEDGTFVSNCDVSNTLLFCNVYCLY